MMDSISSVSPSIVLPPKSSNPLQNDHHRQRIITFSSPFLKPSSQFRLSLYSQESSRVRRRCHHYTQVGHWQRIRMEGAGGGVGGGGGEREEDDNWRRDEEVERALHMDGTIPGSSNEFVKQVSFRAYNMRINLQQTFDSSSYDVLEASPWRESSKPVYVLTHTENQLCTMKTCRNRSKVERELGLLFSKANKRRNQAKHSGNDSKFQMLVEDVREGVLVFEDQNEAAKYCDLLQGGGQDCEGIAEIVASSVFDLCQKMRALAVLFRRGRTPPLPESLKLNLRARKCSLPGRPRRHMIMVPGYGNIISCVVIRT